jgi:UDP-glucose 4-epimerase
MKRKSILVTGGAGYIGSHVVRQLGEAGERVVTLDNLSRGFRDSVLYGEFVEGDTGDSALVRKILGDYNVGTVMHFAAFTIVPESVSDPLKYYLNNTANTRSLIESCVLEGVDQFVFSSTAAVYGDVKEGVASENTPTNPINPYGTSKLMSEWMLRDVAAATSLRYVALRYFNVAGSDPSGRLGQCTQGATLLTKVAVEHAVGLRPHVSIFGTDYDTLDGTGVRDYIHVEDLASAHLCALQYLRAAGTPQILNCGYGRGYSVRQVLDAVARVSGQPLVIKEQPKRAGDPPQLIAQANKIREILGWKPQHDDLDHIVRTAYNWERELLARARAKAANA